MAVYLPGRRPVFSSRPIDITDGLIGYWPLDVDARDYSGRSGFAGTFSGAAIFGPGLVSPGAMLNPFVVGGSSLSFPGNLVTSNVLTVSLWFQASVVAAFQCLFSIYTSDNDAMEIFMDNSAFFYGGNFNTKAQGATTLVAGRLYHVVLTSNGSVTTLFTNAVPDGTPGTTNFTTFSPVGGIGSRPTTFSSNADIDDVRVYNRVLSRAEISTLYLQGLSPPDEGEWPSLFISGATPTTTVLYELINVM